MKCVCFHSMNDQIHACCVGHLKLFSSAYPRTDIAHPLGTNNHSSAPQLVRVLQLYCL